jgi:hypothetical protein
VHRFAIPRPRYPFALHPPAIIHDLFGAELISAANFVKKIYGSSGLDSSQRRIAVIIFLASLTLNSNDSQQEKAVTWDHFPILTEPVIHVQPNRSKPWCAAVKLAWNQLNHG